MLRLTHPAFLVLASHSCPVWFGRSGYTLREGWATVNDMNRGWSGADKLQEVGRMYTGFFRRQRLRVVRVIAWSCTSLQVSSPITRHLGTFALLDL